MKHFRLVTLLITAALVLVGLNSCTGYRVGNVKPAEMETVKTIFVPLVENDTQEQRLASLMTNSLVDTITRDGTYKIGTEATADARLEVKIRHIRYTARRYDRFDSLRASEMYMYIQTNWRVMDNQNKVLSRGSDQGRTQFSIEENQQTSRNNAFPVAAEATAVLITQRIANGF